MSRQQGVTFIELLVAIVVLSLMLAIAQPLMHHVLAHQRSQTHIDNIYQDLAYARQLAITYQNSITTCPLDDQQRCRNQWQQGYSVFIDTRPFGQFNEGDKLLRQKSQIHHDDHIRASRSQVRFSPSGFTSNTGSIRYCPLSTDSSIRKQVTINATGGIRYNSNPGNC